MRKKFRIIKKVGVGAYVMLQILREFDEVSERDEQGYFPIKQLDLEKQTGISTYKQKSYSAILIKNRFIKKKVVGVPPITHYKVL